MRIILELIRIILIFGLLGGLFSAILIAFYQSMGVTQYEWFGSLAILLFLFINYRNRWQFKGWVKGKEKLPRKFNNYLTSISVLLIILPLMIHEFLQ